MNFLIRLKILLADPKVEAGTDNLDRKIVALLEDALSKWKRCMIRQVYFEKVVSMCKEENSPGGKVTERGRGSKGSKGSKAAASTGGQSANASGVRSESKLATSALLAACLDIFIVLVENAPENGFLSENSAQLKEILSSCFKYARNLDEHEMRVKLRQFVVRIFCSNQVSHSVEGAIVLHINVLIEKLLVDSESNYRKTIASGVSLSENNRQVARKNPEEEVDETCIASFALGIIDDVSQTIPSYYKTFSSAMLNLASTLVKKHIAAASAKQKQSGGSFAPQLGTFSVRQMYHTPVEGIIGESCFPDKATSAVTSSPKVSQVKDFYPAKDLGDFDQSLQSTVVLLQILGDSDVAYSFTQDRKILFQIISIFHQHDEYIKTCSQQS